MRSWGEEPPLGTECLMCHEPIRAGESGGFVAVISSGGTTLRAIHRECEQLQVIGHLFGVCGCTEWAGQPTLRSAALELARRARS